MMVNTTKVVNPTKVKGLFKGLRYISQIFDEEKDEELQIGIPTDVKHVAHIGSDGPSSNDTPSWMREFKASSPTPSSPVSNKGDEPDVKWVSEDSKRGSKAANSPKKGIQDGSRSSRRHHSSEGNNSPRRNSSTKTRPSRRNKESSEGSAKSNISEKAGDAPPDVPKKTRRKKSKDSASGQGSTRSRTKGVGAAASADDDSVKSGPREGDE